MYAYDARSPYEYAKRLNQFQMIDVGHLIDQDLLVLGASQDHFIDYKLFKDELDALSKVRSLTFRLFTEKENASNHCNVGNTKLVLDTMMDWIESIKLPSVLRYFCLERSGKLASATAIKPIIPSICSRLKPFK
jgi:hypothetical protein